VRVLFVCIGNSCRSQMAEGFARAHGRGVWEADSAGLMPANIVAPLTRRVMEEKSISLEEHFPKGLDEVRLSDYDLVVNMSGYEMPGTVTPPVRTWDVRDPIGQSETVYRRVRDEIERLVLDMLSEVRARAAKI
jgi:arsenate reductase (thioredoxin)